MPESRCPYCQVILKEGQPALALHLRVCKEWPKAITQFAYDLALSYNEMFDKLDVRLKKLERALNIVEEEGVEDDSNIEAAPGITATVAATAES